MAFRDIDLFIYIFTTNVLVDTLKHAYVWHLIGYDIRMDDVLLCNNFFTCAKMGRNMC